MIRSLSKNGYVFDEKTQVWTRVDYSGINYSDGDEVESRLATLIESSTDVSVLSPELRSHCVDWPSRYHLSALRANLLRPFHEKLVSADILEVGAGCGAITRFLGECRANVLALEGSLRRARITRSRTRDLENVVVLNERFDDFQCDFKFDIVTLIGVLEYASIFSSAENASRAMLERARSFLKPGGILLVAIENQLGLKYLAGAKEDHMGVAMYGVEGRYGKNQPHTFGREVLDGLLKDAGFVNVEFLVPLPDYKLPVSVITETGATLPDFNAATLASQCVRCDPQLPVQTHFSLELAWPQLFENGLGVDLANSFLIAASPEPIASVDKAVLAHHYSVDRKPRFCKEAIFLAGDVKGEILVKRRSLVSTNPEKAEEDLLEFDVQRSENYILGSTLSWKFYRIVTADGWTLEQVFFFFNDFLNVVECLICQRGLSKLQRSPRATLPGDFFDVVPQNLVTDVKGIVRLIDKEWKLREPLELGYLIFRSILMLINSVSLFGAPASGEIYTRRRFVNEIMCALGLELQESDYQRYLKIEARAQEFVTGVVHGDGVYWAPDCRLPIPVMQKDSTSGNFLELQSLLAQKDGKINELTACIAGKERGLAQLSLKFEALQTSAEVLKYDFEAMKADLEAKNSALSKLETSVAERDVRIRELDEVLQSRDRFIDTLTNSRSWRLTKPLRWSARVMRGEWSLAVAPYKQAVSSIQNKKVLKIHSEKRKSFLEEPIQPTRSVCVILPVYRNVEMTKNCIRSAMPGVLQLDDARLLAINDASPDEGMSQMLSEMENIWPGCFHVLENTENLGFIRTVNKGLAYFPDHDVVLLNSDVLVPNDWLIRLRGEAYLSAAVGTVTPFSNNATICSFPYFLCENPSPFGLDVNAVDKVFRRGRYPCVEAPTGVGFCMFIRRDCLDDVGFLNADRFGRGYGEENDLCQRAIKAGWKNLISPNIYAYHEGGVSFSSDKSALVENAVRVIEELHPNYHSDVQKFIMDDPLSEARVGRHVKLLASLPVPKVLHISHGMGGGVGQHIEELADFLGNKAVSLVLSPSSKDEGLILSIGVGVNANRLEFTSGDYHCLLNLLRAAGVSIVHIHHTLGCQEKVLGLLRDLKVPHLATVHDYYWLAGNPTLTNEDGLFSGDYSEELKNPLYPLPPGETPETWRNSLRPLLEMAEVVIFPSFETRRLFGAYYRFRRDVVAAHVEALRNVAAPVRPFVSKEKYVIGILGALGREKGADYLEEIAVRSQQLGKSYQFKLLGYAYRPLRNIETTGPYEARALHALILQHRCDLIFFPCICPETYSYTLSYALDSGLPIVAPRVGAFPERLAGRMHCIIYPNKMPIDSVLEVFDDFISKLTAGADVKVDKLGIKRASTDFYEDSYRSFLGEPVEVSEASMSTSLVLGGIGGANSDVRTYRERLLCVLWKIYLHPSMRWSDTLFNYGVRRTVKRLFSKRPMHEIVKR